MRSQVGDEGRGAGLLGPPSERLACHANALEGRGEPAERAARSAVPSVPGASTSLSSPSTARASARRRGGRRPGRAVAGLELLEQQLGVADDVIQRRAQLVAKLGRRGRCVTRRACP